MQQEEDQKVEGQESQEMTPHSWKVLWFVFFAWVFDAADGTIYALTLPMIREEFGLSLSQMGMIGSIFLGGAVIGSIILPYLADRKGRRWGMAGCICLYSIFSGFTGVAQNFYHLALARFFTGTGTGGEWPVGAAYLSEVVPAKKRGFAMGLMQSGYPIGYFLAAAIFAGFVALNLGWRGCYFILLIPAGMCFWVLTTLKESERWLKGREEAKLDSNKANVNFRELFRPEYRKFTIIGTLLHVFGGFYSWGLVLWFPSILMLDFKLDQLTTSYITMFMWGIATIGYVVAGPLSDKIGRKRTLTIFVTSSLICVSFINYLKTIPGVPLSAIYVIAALIGCGMGAHTVLISYSSEIFPSHVRSLGLGFAVAVGKGTAMLAPFMLGIIAQKYSVSAGVLVAVCIGWLMVPTIFTGPETAQKRLEDIITSSTIRQ